MKKTILITGSTDGIGLVAAKSYVEQGHKVLLHGRSETKLAAAKEQLSNLVGSEEVETYIADLSVLSQVVQLAKSVSENHQQLDVLINNAGVFVVPDNQSADGLDTRFAVNTIAPYLLTKKLLPILGNTGRVVNLSSAAQTSVNASELLKPSTLSDNAVYAKSKLALTMWSRQMGLSLSGNGPVIVAVNPASLLGSKMVKQAYGIAGGDLQVGADILIRAGLSEEFEQAYGLYFDNDQGRFADPHRDALDDNKVRELVLMLEELLLKHIKPS